MLIVLAPVAANGSGDLRGPLRQVDFPGGFYLFFFRSVVSSIVKTDLAQLDRPPVRDARGTTRAVRPSETKISRGRTFVPPNPWQPRLGPLPPSRSRVVLLPSRASGLWPRRLLGLWENLIRGTRCKDVFPKVTNNRSVTYVFTVENRFTSRTSTDTGTIGERKPILFIEKECYVLYLY